LTTHRSIPLALSLLTVAGLFLSSGLAPAQTKNAKTPAKASAKKQTPAKQTKAKQTKAKAPAAPAARYRRSNQSKPTVDRYVEIQRALHDRGYLEGPVDGKWGKDSEEALKRFQRDQSLKDDGKLGALSLMALGLGPKRPPATVAQTAPGSAPASQVE
jgi:peptidoglycan hydrolase-like protein with peptidoglycan-binding domain